MNACARWVARSRSWRASILVNKHPLPLCDRPLQGIDFRALRAAGDSTLLLDEAERAVSTYVVSPHRQALVHGDCWQGNMMWRDGVFVGFVDWESAGRGPAGIDLGYLRMDVAVQFGPERVEAVLAGWLDADETSPADLAYWDVVAGLCTPADLRDWVPVLAAAGRVDLDASIVSARRDRFLADALAQLSLARS